GNTYICGDTEPTAEVGMDVYLRKLSPTGENRWTHTFGTRADDWCQGVAVDGTGRAFVIGWTNGVFPGQARLREGDSYVGEYGPGGNVIWTDQFGSRGGDRAQGVAVGRADQVIVVGDTDGALPGATKVPGVNGFVMKWVAQ